eukprot:gene5302-3805_t
MMEDPKRQLKVLATREGDQELADDLSSLSTSLIMGTEAYLRSFNVKDGISIIAGILQRFSKVKTYGDTIVMALRALALILEHAPSSSCYCHKLHVPIVQTTSSAIHAALCGEWRHSHTDTSMLLDEGLRVIKFIAVADLTGSMFEHVLIGDLLTLCTSADDALVTRGALETLHALCAKVILPSELETGIVSSLLSIFGGSSSTPKNIKNASNPIVIAIEKIVSPFLVTIIEQLSVNLEAAPDLWSQLELVLQCLGKLIDRSLLCHRHSTAHSIVTGDLPSLLFRLILQTEQNVILEPAVRTSRLLLCESILSSAACCHRDLIADIMTEWEARTFFTSMLTQSMADASTLLDNPFSTHSAASSTSKKKKRDNDHITFIAGIRLFVLACPNIPPLAFGLKSEALLPVHRWRWEDELHQMHNFSEEHCVALESAYSRLDHTCDISAGKTSEEVDLQSLMIRRSLRDSYRNIQRIHIPFAFQYVDESLLRPSEHVKEAGPEVSGSSISSFSTSKFSSLGSDIVNSEAKVSEKNILLAEMYLEMLCVFASKGLGNVARLLSISACASLIHMLLVSGEKKRTRDIIKKTMLPLCAMLDEALVFKDTFSSSIALTMIKWLFRREDEMKWYFTVTFHRCGLLKRLERLALYNSEFSDKARSDCRKAVRKLAHQLHQAIEEKMRSVSKKSLVGLNNVDKLSSAVAKLKDVAKIPGLHQDTLGDFFDALNADVTVYEVFQMQTAVAALMYILNGKNLQDILGQSLVYASEGSGSSWNATTTIQTDFFVVEDEKPLFFERGMQTTDVVVRFVNEERLDCFINSGCSKLFAFQKMIRLLSATLSLDLHLPLVECLVSSERAVCKNPSQVFSSMSECSPRVRLCTDPTADIMNSCASASEKGSANPTTDEQDTKSNSPGKVEFRAHLMSSVGDIERLLRTGSASTKNTCSAPTTQSALQNLDIFLRRVDCFLRDIARQNPNGKEGKVASTLIASREDNDVLLPTLVYEALAKWYTRGSLPCNRSGIPAPAAYLEDMMSDNDRKTAKCLIQEALEERYLLYNEHSGRCPFHKSFFSLLFTEAFNTRNKKILVQLEKMIVSYEEKDLNTGPLATPPLSTRSSVTRSDRGPCPTPSEQDPLSSLNDLSRGEINRAASYTFHWFEGTDHSRCHCKRFSEEFFHTERNTEFSIQLPAIAYREDVTLLSVMHSYLLRTNRLSEVLNDGTDRDIFVSTSVTTLVIRAAAKSALRVALLPAKFALPRWVNYIFSNAKFLIPLSIREKLCRFIAYGARRSLLRYLRRQAHLRSGVGSTVSELARFSNHKFIVDRGCLLRDAFKILKKGADSRLPVSMEFKGDVGVGQGPTAQFYTLLSKELCKVSHKLWNRGTPGDSSTVPEALVVPPPEGLYPAICGITTSVYKREQRNGTVVLHDRIADCIRASVMFRNERNSAYFTVGVALGRSFLDGHVLPLHLSTALFTFLRWGLPPYQLTIRELEEISCAEFPVDLFNFTLEHAKMIDESVARSLLSLAKCDDATLRALQIPFTLPGDDNFELVKDGSRIFVNRCNLGKYQRRVISALMYESVAVPIRLIAAGFGDVVPREALMMLHVHEISRLLCGEMRNATEPLWTYDEIRTVLVGDHGYQNDSAQIEMLAEVLSHRLTPNEQQAFMFFATGCPRLPLGGIRALGAITVVKRTDFFAQHLDEDGDGADEHDEHYNTSSTEASPHPSPPALVSARTVDDTGSVRCESDWALPSVNTCFRYVKLPPYPTVELMHKKLLLSITQSGDTFEFLSTHTLAIATSFSFLFYLYCCYQPFSSINKMNDPKVFKSALPRVKENKKFIRRNEKREQKRIAEEEKEFAALHGKRATKKALASSSSKKIKSEGTKKKKERRPKTVVARAPTGKETFLKHQAKELVKVKKSDARKGKKKPMEHAKKTENLSWRTANLQSTADHQEVIYADNPSNMEKHLLMKTIQGDDANANEDSLFATALYPDFPMTGDSKDEVTASEDEVLAKANTFFQNLNKKERELNRAAALHMKRLKEINRRGGDKDGFKYVLPNSTKDLVRQMMMKEDTSAPRIDPSLLSSSFGSSSVAEEEGDKPMRKSRRHGGTYSDFYQFQVSKRWTRNAEKFLFRDRVDKSILSYSSYSSSIKSNTTKKVVFMSGYMNFSALVMFHYVLRSSSPLQTQVDMGKPRNLWSEDGGTKAVSRPKPVHVAKKWTVTPDVLPVKSEAPRRRKLAPIRPNNRPAVPLPLEGQSYNPTDADHQKVMKMAVRKLEKKQREHQKFVKQITFGRDQKFNNNMSEDTNWEEEVKEVKEKTIRPKTDEERKREAEKRKKKEKKLKKLGKSKSEKEVQRSFPHRRHPDRVEICAEVDELDKLLERHQQKQQQREVKRQKRRQAKKENMAVKHYGRYYHTPLVVDVASSDQLVGSLRHISGGNVHPALDRMKSLEERNLVPARMRHSYNKRRILKPKGEVRVKREPFGITPETSF